MKILLIFALTVIPSPLDSLIGKRLARSNKPIIFQDCVIEDKILTCDRPCIDAEKDMLDRECKLVEYKHTGKCQGMFCYVTEKYKRTEK